MKSSQNKFMTTSTLINAKKSSTRKVVEKDFNSFIGYLRYSVNEDICNSDIEEEDIDPKKLSLKKKTISKHTNSKKRTLART